MQKPLLGSSLKIVISALAHLFNSQIVVVRLQNMLAGAGKQRIGIGQKAGKNAHAAGQANLCVAGLSKAGRQNKGRAVYAFVLYH